MTRADLVDAAAVMVGPAPSALVDATERALTDAGARVERLDDDAGEAAAEVDIGVCFAMPAGGDTLDRLTDEQIDTALDAALTRPRRHILELARRMSDGGGGSIVVVGTIDTTHAYPGRAVASIAMGGLLGLIRSMAVELAGAGVRANLVIVGPLDGEAASAADDARDARIERTLQRSPIGRFGSPEEVAAAVRFLAGDASGFMTGQTLRVDGGWASLNQTPDGMRFR